MLAICDKSEFYIGDMPGKTLINEQSGGGGGESLLCRVPVIHSPLTCFVRLTDLGDKLEILRESSDCFNWPTSCISWPDNKTPLQQCSERKACSFQMITTITMIGRQKRKKLKSNINGWVMFPRLVPVWLSLSPSRSIELVKYRYIETYLRTGER